MLSQLQAVSCQCGELPAGSSGLLLCTLTRSILLNPLWHLSHRVAAVLLEVGVRDNMQEIIVMSLSCDAGPRRAAAVGLRGARLPAAAAGGGHQERAARAARRGRLHRPRSAAGASGQLGPVTGCLTAHVESQLKMHVKIATEPGSNPTREKAVVCPFTEPSAALHMPRRSQLLGGSLPSC